MTAVEPLLLRPIDAAKSLAISPSLLWKLTRAGKIPAVRLNRSLRYDPEALRQWIADRQNSVHN
jgi:predicted DNA-binding transcriptional regulator AlpA